MSCLPICRLLPFFVLAAGTCFSPPIAAGTDPASTALDGTWKLVSVDLDGEERPIDEDVRWVITNGKVLYGGEPLAVLTSYPASTPKGIDLAFHDSKKEKEYEGIYSIEQGRLKVCLNTRTSGPKERPSDFSTKEKPNLRVFTFQRMLPADEGPGPQKGFVGMALSLENGGQDVAIGSVLENSPAEKAGLRAGDVVLSVGDEKVRDLQMTVDAVRRKMPGSEIRIRVRREGIEKEIAIKVAVFPFSLLGLLG